MRTSVTPLAAIAFASLILLSGCDLHNGNSGPASAAMVNGEFTVAVCAAIDAASISASSASVGESKWQEIWKANGEIELHSGAKISAQNLNELMPSPELAKEPPADLQHFSLTIVSASGTGAVVAGFDFQKFPMTTEGWVHPDGTVTVSPCEGGQ
jgi:hypothetical protein